MDEITLFTVVRPAAPEFADDERGQARGLLLAAAAAERTAGPQGAAGPRHRRRWPRRLVAIPVAAALGAAALVVALAHPGEGAERLASARCGPSARSGLRRQRRLHHGPSARPGRRPASYNAEFKAHGLDITLSLVPVSPSLVGSVVEISTDGPDGNSIAHHHRRGECWTGGGGHECPVGLRIPDGYRGQAAIAFGRAARPGEQYESTAPVDAAPGEAMYGLKFPLPDGRHGAGPASAPGTSPRCSRASAPAPCWARAGACPPGTSTHGVPWAPGPGSAPGRPVPARVACTTRPRPPGHPAPISPR